jgi:hypothetical protein
MCERIPEAKRALSAAPRQVLHVICSVTMRLSYLTLGRETLEEL